MKTFFALTLAILVVLSTMAGCSKGDSDSIQRGTVSKNIYHNEHFGMSVTFPDGWHVQDQESHDALVDVGKDYVAGEDPQVKAAIESAESRLTNLFAVFEFPVGAAVTFNPSVIATAESLAMAPGVTSGADVIFHTRRFLESSQLDVTILGETEEVMIDGKAFAMLRADLGVNGLTVHQKYYAFVADGQAMSMVLSFNTDEQEAALEAILATVEFD